MLSEGVHLLLVEDDASYANVLKKYMVHMGGAVLHWQHCERLDEAERLLSAKPFDLVLLDLRLPDSEGFETFARLAAAFPEVGIIVLTGLKDEDLAIRTVKQGAYDYLVKGRVSRENLHKALQYAFMRRRADKRQRQSEALYRRIFEAHPLPMWIEEAENHRILAVNDAAIRHYGYSREQFLEKTGGDLLDDGTAQIRPPQEQKSAPPYRRHRLANGTVIYVEISSNPTEFEGRPAQMVAVQDVTARVEQEAALRRQAALLQETLRIGHMGSWSYEPARGHLYWSKETGALFGMSGESCEGTLEDLISLVHPDDVKAVKQFLEAAPPPGKWATGDFRVLRQNGAIRWMHARARAEPSASGEELRRTGVIADVTEDRETRTKILRSARMLRMAGEKARLGWWHVDLVEKRAIWSEETALIHKKPPGFSPTIDEAISYYTPECREIISQAFKRCVEEGEAYDVELQIVNSANERVWVRSIGELLQDAEGRAIGVQGAFQDISRQKQEEIRQLAERQILEKIAERADLTVILALIAKTCRTVTDAVDAAVILPENAGAAFLEEMFKSGFSAEESGRDPGHFVADLAAHPYRDDLAANGWKHRSTSCWAIPLRDAKAEPAALVVFFYAQPAPPSPDDQQFVARISPLIRLAIEQARGETELEESDLRFRHILNEIPNVSVQGYNMDGGVSYWNNASEKLYGYSREEAMGRSLLDLIIPDELRAAVEASLSAMRAGGPAPPAGELLLKGKDGNRICVYSSHVGLRRANGSVEMFCVDIDLRSRKAAEQRLCEQAALLDKATDSIVVRDLENQVLFWNQSAQRLYGWSSEEVSGKALQKIIFTDEAGFREATAAVLTEGEWKGETEHLNRWGETLRVEDRWTLVRDEQGQPKNILSITTDVTERRKLEQQFLRAQRMESIGTLAGGIAHDLNNVLSPIMMSMDLLKMRATDETTQELIENVRTSARRGAEMVKQILSFARGMEGTRMKMQIRHLIREVSSICIDTFPPNIEIRTYLPSDLHTIEGDPTQIHQVLLNLCVNARDAMPTAGVIKLSAENVDIDEQFSAMNIEAVPGPHVRVEISDTGSGIPANILTKIFDPFFTTKNAGHGTGLGLATVLTIMKSHGGFIRVESPPGKGATFHLFLPACPGSHRNESTDGPQLPRGNGEWILVVDDEASVREITKQTLEAFGYRVLLASDGAEGVSIFANRKKDIAIVLADLTMPVMDGLAMVRVIRRLKAETPVIAASGMREEERKGEAMAAGIAHFLPKPYTASSLLRMLRRAFEDKPSLADPRVADRLDGPIPEKP